MKKILLLSLVCVSLFSQEWEGDNIFLRDTLYFDGVSFHPTNYIKWTDTTGVGKKIVTKHDFDTLNEKIPALDTFAAPSAGQIAIFETPTKIGGSDTLGYYKTW